MSEKKTGVPKGDPRAVEAGRMGGKATREARGREYFQAIGKLGGAAMLLRYGREHFSEAGRMGAAARKGGERPERKKLVPQPLADEPAAPSLTWWDVYSAIEWLAIQRGQPVDIADICLLLERGPLGIAEHLDALRAADLIAYADRGVVLVPGTTPP